MTAAFGSAPSRFFAALSGSRVNCLMGFAMAVVGSAFCTVTLPTSWPFR